MGGKTTKSTQAISIPPEVLARYNAINARADTVTNRPYNYYQGQFVAPLTATQQAGIANTNAAAGMAQPYYGAAGQAYGAGLDQGQQYLGEATGYARSGGQAVNASDLNGEAINKYMSPFLDTVLQGTAGILNQQNQQQQSGQMGNAIRSGAFGGDRGGIAAANLNQQQNLANSKIFSEILNQGYNNALNTAIGQQAVNLGAAQANRTATQQTADRIAGLGQQGYEQFTNTGQKVQDLGTTAQGAALSGAGAQMAAGQAEQATQQAENTAKYNEFLQAQSLPYQQLKLASDIALGTGTASGSTTTTAQPGGFFSDERLKENIKAVGKTFDGQTIHSYNYKGDPRTQIGLIAQEVQKHHPEAVGLAAGYKTVDYDKATEDAADRGHMASGGLASAGGSVMPQDAGQGFSSGGLAGFDPSVMQQMLAAQQAMYAPLSSGNMYAGGPNAGGGLVPQSSVAASQLMTPAALSQQATGAEKAKAIVDLGNSVNKFGEGIGAWGDDDKKPEDDKDKGVGKALGGGVPYSGQGLDIPQEDTASKSYQLPTAGSMEKPESGLDKVGKIAKIAGTVASIFSDKRMKENIKPIGKLFDGQIVHSYNYKGDPRTQIGLLAQEVEGHKPHAVGLAGKYKTVDYAKATSGAAKRGHFAMGGETEEGYDSQETHPADDQFLNNLLRGASSGKNIHPITGEELPMQIGEESPQEAAGLAGGTKAGMPKALMAAKANEFAKPKGLAPATGALPTGIMQIARLIHAGEGTGKNPSSSAKGPYQFIDSTFAGEFRKHYPDRAKGMTDREIIALKHGPEGAAISEAMGPKLIAGNARIVERAGFEPDAGNVYLAHFLGPDTAVKVLRADPNAPISHYVSAEAIRANPPLQKNPTVGGAINWARGYMSKQAERLSRQQRASGGLAGRNGYALDGRVEDENKGFQLSDQVLQDVNDAEKTDKLIQGLDVQKVQPGPETKFPEEVVQPVALGAGSPENMARAVAGTEPGAQQQPAKRAGLAKRVFGYDKERPYDPKTNNKFLQRLGHGETDAVMAAIQGLAAMGSAPTRSLGVALSTGLGAGAQGYQAQREFARQKQETGIRGFGAETARMQIPISQQIANTQTISGLKALRDKAQQNLMLIRVTGGSTNNPLYQQAQAEYEAISRKIYEKEKIEGLEPAKAGTGEFIGEVDFSKPADMQRLGFGLAVAGMPGAEVPTNVATAARDSGRVLTDKGVEPVEGFAGTTADIEATKTGAIGATENNRIVYDTAMKNWQDVKLNVIPVLEQLPTKLPETGLTGSALSNLASAVRVLASTQGYDASGINGDDPRSVLNAAGQMLGVPISADNPTAAVKAIVQAMKAKVWQMSNAARAADSWASQNSDPRTGRPDYSRGNVQDLITKAMAQ
jgi:hypothetical protein